MKKIIFRFNLMLFVLLAFSANTFSQSNGDIMWKRNFGGNYTDEFRSVTAVSDGIIVVGSSSSFNTGDWAGIAGGGSTDAIILKYNNNGNILWRKNLIKNRGSFFNSVTAVSDGIIAVGMSNSSTIAIIVKYDNNGNLIWQRDFEGYYATVTTALDGIIAVGSATSFGNNDWEDVVGKGLNDAIIVKYDNAGNVLWKKNFGGSSSDRFHSVTAVSDGVIAVGYSMQASFGNGDWEGITAKGFGSDAIIVKYNNNGDIVWKRNFGGNHVDTFNSVTAVSDGIIAVGNSFADSFGYGDWAGIARKGGQDATIIKYNHNGDMVWRKSFGGSGDDFYNSVTAVGNRIIAVGRSVVFNNGDWVGIARKGMIDAIIVEYDNNGDVVWRENFGGNNNDYYISVATVGDNIIAVGCSSFGSFGNGDWVGVWEKGEIDGIIVKYTIRTTDIILPSMVNQPKIVGLYSITGVQLQKQPEKGVYIIMYDDGVRKKVIK